LSPPPKPMEKELVPTFRTDLTQEEYDDMFPCLVEPTKEELDDMVSYTPPEQRASVESLDEHPSTHSDPKCTSGKSYFN
ncbi:hypothetical protein A2U01_0051697, partial [Trifolium medium]|nr:hypothetical protein [Trifolium medium]